MIPIAGQIAMTVALSNRVRETSTTTGTSVVVMAGAVSGFRAFAEVLSLSDRFYYLIENRAAPSEWEIGEGYLSGLGNTLNRSRVLDSSNSGALVNFSAGTKDVRVAMPAQALRQPVGNVLINGGFDVWFRQAAATATARADGAIGPERSYVLTQTASITTEQVAGGTTSLNALKLTQHQATAQRFGIAQVVEAANCRHLRGQPVIMQGVAKASASQAHRIALVEWTGTVNEPTRDIVNNWGSSTYTAGNFFLASNLTIAAVGSFTPAAATRTPFELRGSISNSCNNLYAVIWTEGTAAQNYTLELEEWGVYLGTERRLWTPRPLGQEEQLCLPYCQAIAGASLNGLRSLTQNMLFYPSFAANFRKVPTFSHNITGYTPGFSPGATEFSGFNISAAANVTITGAFSLTADGWNANRMRLVAAAGTSFSGAGGDTVSGALGSGVRLIFDSEL